MNFNSQIFKTSKSKKYILPYETFGHAGLHKVHDKNNFLYQCPKSFVIYRNKESLNKKLKKLFFSNKYTLSRYSSHIDSKNIGKKNVSHYKTMANIIKTTIKSEPQKVLDIGCYDGELLNELSKKFKKSQFYGYDVSPSIKKLFKKNCKFQFVENLNLLTQKYDLIVCVNTFQYVPNIDDFIKNIKQLLSKDGRIFFLNIFLDKNPFSILYGDQYVYFTENNFKNLLRSNNLNGKTITNSVEFPRNLIGVFKHTKKKYKFLKSKKISYYLEYLKKTEYKLSKIKSKEVNIFGTTISAKFIFNAIKNKFNKINFIDENPYKINKIICGRKIIHPSKLEKNSLVLIPYGKTNHIIISKLKKKYDFKYLKL
jgi:2-polyprenyl-3-methyl-5-hydroxy-6-metoxy-1,4-benzoquinol methylase